MNDINNIRLIILGNLDKYSDEAQEKVTYLLLNELSKKCNVMYFNAKRNLFNNYFWKSIRFYEPHIVHIFLRPTIFTLLYARLIKSYLKGSKIIFHSLQPSKNKNILKKGIKILKPDLFITVSNKSAKYYRSLGCKTEIIPVGVDTDKFIPIDREKKILLRKKYRIPIDKYILLHVGHALPGRNLMLFKKLTRDNFQVLIVTSKSYKDEKIIKSLNAYGAIIISDYIAEIQEIYQLSDVYIFPTLNESNAIEMPLSILEAMACNLPIITTPFGAIYEKFEEDNDFLFFNGTENDLISKINYILSCGRGDFNRRKIMIFHWEYIIQNLLETYKNIINND
jgi:glycosyltransferase involved in cell wall biosynthesis